MNGQDAITELTPGQEEARTGATSLAKASEAQWVKFLVNNATYLAQGNSLEALHLTFLSGFMEGCTFGMDCAKESVNEILDSFK